MSHYKPYPTYKDSGVKWLKNVPTHWRIERLANSFEERRTKVSDKEFPALSVTKLGVVPQLETVAKTDDGDNRKLVRMGDIAINSRSDRKGSSGLADRDGSVSLIITVLKPKSSVWGRYCHHLIRSEIFQEEYFRMGNGLVADLWTTNYSSMRTITLALPPIEEQKAIAKVLDSETVRIDALVEKKSRFIELLREKRQALIAHAVTKGLNPNVPMKDSGVQWLGEVPEHWRVAPLKYSAAFLSGGTPSKENNAYWGGDVPWASAKDLKQDKLDDTQDHITAHAIAMNAASLVPPGSILVVVRGMILARTFPVTETLVPMAINQDLKAIIPKNGMKSGYFAQLLRGLSAETLSRLEEAGHGTKALRMENWLSMDLPIPPEDEQQAILDFLDREVARIDSVITKTERSIELLKERRSAFITAAVTGQIDVRDTAVKGGVIGLRRAA